METKENRFKLARTVYNKNGNQSTEKVYKATKISKSMIEDLESNVLNPRNTGYLTVAKLAQYYGVSIDYLAGLTEYPSPQADIRSICEYTGLTGKSIELLHYLNDSTIIDDKKTLLFLNLALSDSNIKRNEDFPSTTIFSFLYDYVKAFEVTRSYPDLSPAPATLEEYEAQQRTSEFEKKNVIIESSEDMSEVISISELYKPFKMKQITKWLDRYSKEAEEKK